MCIRDSDHPLIIKVDSIQSARMQVYFIDNDDYFKNRMQAMDENGIEYDDNDSRAIFYARGVLETCLLYTSHMLPQKRLFFNFLTYY